MLDWCVSLLIGCFLFVGGANANPKITYKITVTTSNAFFSGPADNDQIFVKLTGLTDETEFKELVKKTGDFDRGSESKFSITAKDVGKITEITIKKTATGTLEAWKLKKMTIEDSRGTIYEFSCECWISRDRGLQITLKPANIINQEHAAGSTISPGATSNPTTSSNVSSAKPSGSSSASPSGVASKPTSGPTSGITTGSSSVSPSGAASKPTSSAGPTTEKGTASIGSKPTGPTSKPTTFSGATSKKTTASVGSKPSGPTSKPTEVNAKSSASSSPKPSTPSTGPTSGSSGPSSVKPSASSNGKSSPSTGPTSENTFVPTSPKLSASGSGKSTASTGPTSGSPSGPSSVKPSASSSGKSTASTEPTSENTSGPTSVKPSASSSGKSTASTGPTSKSPSGPSSVIPSASSSGKSTSSIGPTSGSPSAPTSVKPTGTTSESISGASSTKPSGPSSAKPSGGSTSPTQSTPLTSIGSESPSPGNGSKPTSATPSSQASSPAHSAFVYDLLQEMNRIRLLHGVGLLLLEKNMSQAAQKEATKLSKRHSVSGDTETTYGINTCKITGSTPGKNEAKQCVSTWYKTVKDFDWPQPAVTTKSAQFTRMVWKATTHVGIGVSGSEVAVYFDPPSNQAESAKDNVLPVTDIAYGIPQGCSPGFKLSGRSCFSFNPTPFTWEKAIEQCAHHGATLASVQSQEENTFLTGMLSGSKNQETEAWLGFNDRLTESRYQWVDGSAVNFYQFLPTEPTGVGENCVALKNSINESGWEDKKCSDALPFLCRHPAKGYITYKITFLIEIGAGAHKGTAKTVIAPGDKDHATLIREKINSTNTGKPLEFVGESKETKPDGGNYLSLFVKAPPGSDPNLVQPLQDYLDANDNRITPDSNDQVFIVSVTISNPADGMCYSTCFTTCSNQCNPMCCSGSFIISPSALAQPQPAPYPQASYSYPNVNLYSSSSPSSYLPQYPYPQQNGLASSNPYMSPSSMGCVRECTRIPRNGFCPPYCSRKCCGARLLRHRIFK